MTNRLRELRKAHGLSQMELSRLTGLAQNTISLAELNKREPHPRTVSTLANFFGVSRPYLMGYEKVSSGKSQAPQLLEWLRELPVEDRRLLLRGVWDEWTTDDNADARVMDLANELETETGASVEDIRRALISLDPFQARRLMGEAREQREAELIYQGLLLQAAAAGDLSAPEAARRAKAFRAAPGAA